MPIVYPVLSRLTMLFIVVWSATLSVIFHNIPLLFRTIFFALGVYATTRYMLSNNEKADRRNYLFYNVSPSAASLHAC